MRPLLPAFALMLAAAAAVPAGLATERQPGPVMLTARCAVMQSLLPDGGDPVRPTSESGSIPCPQYLSTTAIQRPPAQHRT